MGWQSNWNRCEGIGVKDKIINTNIFVKILPVKSGFKIAGGVQSNEQDIGNHRFLFTVSQGQKKDDRKY